MSSVMARGVTWIQDKAAKFEPDQNRVLIESGQNVCLLKSVCLCVHLSCDREGY
jgi:hypothetical protein